MEERKMLFTFNGKSILINDNLIEKYRRTTGMDIYDTDTYVRYCASNKGVSCDTMTSSEIKSMIEEVMNAEMEVCL